MSQEHIPELGRCKCALKPPSTSYDQPGPALSTELEKTENLAQSLQCIRLSAQSTSALASLQKGGSKRKDSRQPWGIIIKGKDRSFNLGVANAVSSPSSSCVFVWGLVSCFFDFQPSLKISSQGDNTADWLPSPLPTSWKRVANERCWKKQAELSLTT